MPEASQYSIPSASIINLAGSISPTRKRNLSRFFPSDIHRGVPLF